MRLDGGKSPDIPCLGGKCKNRVPADIPKAEYRYQLCDSCWEKRQQEKILAKKKEKKDRIKWEKKLKEAHNASRIVCGLCSLRLKKNQVCPKCHPLSVEKGENM